MLLEKKKRQKTNKQKTPSGYRSYLSVVELWVHFCFIPFSTTSFKSLHYYFFEQIHVSIPLFLDQFYILLLFSAMIEDNITCVTATLLCSPPTHQVTILSYHIIMPQFSKFKVLVQSNIDSSIFSN